MPAAAAERADGVWLCHEGSHDRRPRRFAGYTDMFGEMRQHIQFMKHETLILKDHDNETFLCWDEIL